MKIRLDYVTNSSSSSFYVLKMTNKDILEKIKGTGFEEVAVYEEVTDEGSDNEKVLEKMLQMIEKQSGEEYCYQQDQYELLAETYIAVLENEKKIKAAKKDILIESHDEYWGEFVENLVEEHGIACHYADIDSVTFDNEGNMQNKFRLEFYEEPGSSLQADADALEMLINGEASIENYLEGLDGWIGDTTPVLIAFQKGLRKKKGLLDDEIKKIMGEYYDQAPEAGGSGEVFNSLQSHNLIVAKQITGCGKTAIILADNGKVYTGSTDQIGVGNKNVAKDLSNYKQLEGLPAIKNISAGGQIILLLTVSGDVYMMKWDEKGDDDKVSLSKPVLIEGMLSATSIAAGVNCFVLTADGSVCFFGQNPYGQFGYEPGMQVAPQKVENLPPAISVSTCSDFSLFLTGEGTIYSCGMNYCGEVGQKSRGLIEKPEPIQELPPIVAISTGFFHSLALAAEGSVYSFGKGENGRLGHGDHDNWFVPGKITGIPKVKAIAAGGYHSLLLTAEGVVYSFGEGTYGQLGQNDREDRLQPTPVAGITEAIAIAAWDSYSLILHANGDLSLFGDGTQPKRRVVVV